MHERGCWVQVWAEVQHCEERVQLLCTIARAVETHVSILQDELCKAGALLLIKQICRGCFSPALWLNHPEQPPARADPGSCEI